VVYFALDELVLKKEDKAVPKQIKTTKVEKTKKAPTKKKEIIAKEIPKKSEAVERPVEKEKQEQEKAKEIKAAEKVESPSKTVEKRVEKPQEPVKPPLPSEEVVKEEVKPVLDIQGDVGESESVKEIPDDTVTVVEDKVGEEQKTEEERFDYVSPPDYLKFGRGLVYNCKGKHWACVDKESFFICRKNQKHFNKMGKPTECFSKSVYSSNLDCRTVQVHFINTNEKTDFCK
jgi:hypothetical protein